IYRVHVEPTSSGQEIVGGRPKSADPRTTARQTAGSAAFAARALHGRASGRGETQERDRRSAEEDSGSSCDATGPTHRSEDKSNRDLVTGDPAIEGAVAPK